MYVLSHFSCVQLFVTLWTAARQAPLSMGFSRQEYYSGLPCPPPGDQTHVSCVSSITGRFFTHWATWEALQVYYILVLNQIHQLNHQAPQRSLPETSAKDVSLWLKPVLYNVVCLLTLNQTGLAHIGGRTHLLLALSCFSEYKTYLVIVAAAKSHVTHNRAKRSFRS